MAASINMIGLDEDRLRDLMKSALVEVLEERRDLIRDILEETLEDIALVRAIEEGRGSPRVGRDEVFAIFGGAA